MTAPTYGFWDYVKEAFLRRAHLPGLGHMPLNLTGMACIGVLGLWNPGFWLLGIAVEIAYLVLKASSPRFQKLIQGEALLRQQKGGEVKVQQVLQSLSPSSMERYRRLVEQCRLILGLQGPADPSGPLGDLRGGSLNQLLWLFIRLLSSRELMIGTLQQVNPTALEGDVAKLKERLAQADPESPLGRSLKATLDIQTKRLENLTKAKGNLEVVESELDRIEQQVRLIREESAVSGGPEFISARLDQVSATLSETSQWMDQHAEFFSSLAVDEPLAAGLTAPAPPAAAPTLQPPPPGPPPVPPPRKRQREGG
jgi:hypothetical protein